MDTNRFGRFDVLVVEPDASATASARTALEKLGARCFVVADLEGAKRCVAQHRIGGVILGPSVSTRAARELLDGLSFDRRRRPRLIRMSPRDPSAGRLGEHVADVLAYVPLLDSAVVAAVGMKESEGTPAGPTHAAALVRATSLPGGIGESMRDVASTLRMAFTADACVIVGTSFGDAWIVGTGASLSQTELVELRERVLGAARGRTVVVSSELVTRGAQGACGFESTLGARIIGPDNVRVGLIALVQRGFRAYRGDERELLDAFGRRLAIELSHRGVKDHLVAELDATREAGGLDPMLGVWSESTLLRLLEMMTASALRNKAPLTVAVVDVRELGRINDLYGHEAGDAVLKHVAELVVYIVRQSDVVARFRGGIAVVFDDTTPADAATVIKRVQTVFASEDFVVDAGVAIHVETRSGISALKNDGDNAESLLQRAIDAARAAADTKEGLWTSTQPAGAEDAMPVGPGDEGLRGLTLGGMYRLLHQIGSGGGGGVYRGEDLGLNRPVAIKVLNPEQAHSEQANERFRAEAAILAALRHPNLVQVYAFGVDAGYAYFVMELVEGESVEVAVARRREEGRQFPLATVKSIVKQIGFALDTLHRSGVVHRDVKPANILLDPFRDRAVLVDVGIARKPGDAQYLAGTPPYMAPEIFTEPLAGLAVDVFGFAATVYEMLTLETPWPSTDTIFEMVQMKKTVPPKPLSAHRPELAPLDAIFERGLHPDPDERHDTITTIAAELRRALSSLQQQGSGPSRHLSGQVRAVAPDSEPAPRSLSSGWVTSRASGVEPHTRIAVFRAFARVLGARRIARWRVDLARQDPALADALSPTKPPLGWLPTRLLHDLLNAAPLPDEDAEQLGRALGQATVRATFRRFFPATPETLSSRSIVAAVDKIWAQYHSWGSVETAVKGSSQASVTITEVVDSAPILGWVVGMLEQVLHFSGGVDVAVAYELTDEGAWRVELSWT